jgi:crotonobetaine/carnitine-CoA ligase
MAETFKQTLTAMLYEQAGKNPGKTALTIVGQDLTYADLVGKSNSVARGLRQFGVGRHSVVATLAGNSADQVLLQFACARLGALEVMLNTAYRGTFLAHQLNISGAENIIVDRELVPAVLEIAQELPALRRIIVRGRADVEIPTSLEVARVEELHGHATGDLNELPDPLWSDPATIAFTSGTTGLSKGAVLSQNYLCNFAKIESLLWYRSEQDAFYSCGPLFHLAAKGIGVLGSLYRGVRCVQDDRFSVSRFWPRIREENCNATLMLGSMAMLLWTREPTGDEGVPTVVCIPAPPQALQQEMSQRWACSFESNYGLSEAAPLSRSGPDIPLRPGTSGKITPELFDVRIFDDEDCELPAGQVGEVVVRPMAPHIMFDGYYRNPEASLERFRNLWFHTGDLGKVDEDGYFHFVDRKDDYLRRRGENISSQEVEAALCRHPAVLEAAVVGVDSAFLEQEVKAVIAVRAGMSIEPADLVSHCVATMPYFAVPRYIEFAGDLPRTPSGKVRKHLLRESGVAGCWDREAAGIRLTGKRESANRE